MAAYERVTLNRGGRNSRFDCMISNHSIGAVLRLFWIHFVDENQSGASSSQSTLHSKEFIEF